VDCPDDVKFHVVEEARKQLAREHKLIDIDGVRVLFLKRYGLIRASNTQPALVLRFEATAETALKRIREVVESQVRKSVAGGAVTH
jgi:phosphomannomutase/phosphoglucomutase